MTWHPFAACFSAFRCKSMAGLLAALGGLNMQQAWSACTVAAQSVNFGTYNPVGGAAVDGTGNIAVTCDSGVTYAIALSSGSGSFEQRTLGNGMFELGYNLYTNAARLTVWGDGTGPTSTVSGVGSGVATEVPVYGRIPGGQKVPAGTYSDTIVVTVTF